ncbi:acyl-CoA dehydrogenase [Siccirubricoccus deserti]|uniref:Acyl-CoA/acyl-ACP dehydrogenase n=1 Tax=Siccirubricoccus deserti TaxID=2013562 RepID=A0A9X0UG27_9PROT|nr:acyl-CoA dehydrogenase family protein [Siccirubricoccus deserti]MBC4018493.1 acyl-CoA/acyl-ACP dehydrogenase [Siccirubricoccus deserti]GGC66193.1 acyl-CoA dehydrogenase [Siccirubricoccus deserti]
MSFAAAPMVPGDLFDSASRLAAACDARFARLIEPEARAALLTEVWQEITALGWPAVAVAEEAGGAGGTLRDVAALVEGGARSALALPLASAFGVVPLLLAGAGGAGGEVLAGIAAGTHRVAAAIAPVHGTAAGSPMAARWSDAAPRLSGAMIGIDCPPDPTHFLVTCRIEGEAALLLVPRGDDRVTLRHHERIDGRPTIDLHFGEDRRLDGTLLARGEAVGEATARALRAGAFLACVEAVAAMGALLEQTIAYLSNRVQFDAPLASFQALRHKVAELYVAQENARALVTELLDRVAAPGAWPDRDLDLAKLYLGPASRRFAATTIQLHGGMGMTEELPASRLAKRLLMVEFEYGDTASHEARLLAADPLAEASA